MITYAITGVLVSTMIMLAQGVTVKPITAWVVLFWAVLVIAWPLALAVCILEDQLL